jgi:hypothetical protein
MGKAIAAHSASLLSKLTKVREMPYFGATLRISYRKKRPRLKEVNEYVNESFPLYWKLASQPRFCRRKSTAMAMTANAGLAGLQNSKNACDRVAGGDAHN